jgi:hypothetical protein
MFRLKWAQLTESLSKVLPGERRGRSSAKASMTDNEPNALDGFTWGIADNPAGIPDNQRWCVRNSLCAPMGWSFASPEAR